MASASSGIVSGIRSFVRRAFPGKKEGTPSRYDHLSEKFERSLDGMTDEELTAIHNSHTTGPEVEQALREADALFEQWKAGLPQRGVRRLADPDSEGSSRISDG